MNPSASEPGRHLISGTLSIFLAEALIFPTGFITAVYLARQLGPEDYGRLALVSMVVIGIEWSCIAIFSSATIKFIGETMDWPPIATTVLRLQLLVGGSSAVLLWFISLPLSRLLNEPVLAYYLKLFAIDIPITCLSSANINIMVGRGYFKKRALVSASRLTARLGLIILLVEMGLSVRGAIIGSIGASIIELVMSWFYVRPSLFSKATIPVRQLWDFAAPLFLSTLSLRIFRLDLVALKVLGGTAAQAGFYSAAMNLSIPPTIFSVSMFPPLLSTLGRLLSEGNNPKAKEIGQTALRSVLWLMPFAAMTAGAAPEIVCFIFGGKYLPTSPILALLIFAALGLLAMSITRAILIALGRPVWTFRLTGPMVPLALIGYVMLIPHLDGLGAAIVVTVVAGLGAFVSIFVINRIWGLLPLVKTLFKSAICSGIALALAILWPTSGPMLILKITVIIVIVLLTFLLLREFSSSEIALVRSLFRWQPGIEQK